MWQAACDQEFGTNLTFNGRTGNLQIQSVQEMSLVYLDPVDIPQVKAQEDPVEPLVEC